LEIASIYMVGENGGMESIDIENMNTDVIVTLRSGDKYVASFVTYKRLFEMIEEHRITGAFLSGRYYWMKNMVLIQKLNKTDLRDVIDHLVVHGDFQLIFEKI